MADRDKKNWFKTLTRPTPAAKKITRTPVTSPDGPHFSTIVKAFGRTAYNGPKTQDFVDRATSFMAAARVVAKRSATYPQFKIAEFDGFDGLEEEVIRDINYVDKEHHVDMQIDEKTNIRLLTDEEEKKQKLDAFLKKLVLYKRRINKLVFQVVGLLVETGSDEALLLMLKEIIEAEKQLTAKQGRPSILHQYQLPNDSTGATDTFYSAHQVVGQMFPEQFDGKIRQMIPGQLDRKKSWDDKTDRSSGHSVSEAEPHYTNPGTIRDTEGLPNFVRTSFSVETTRDPEVLFEGYRHSSIPPIGVHDRIHRHAMAMRNAKQLIIQMARNKLADRADGVTGPVLVDISSMSLLSNDFLEFFRSRENENKQVFESTMALRCFNGRTLTDVYIDDKTTVTIKVKAYNMSVGCNNNRKYHFGRFGRRDESKINQRGFIEHSLAMLDYLRKNKPAGYTGADEILGELRKHRGKGNTEITRIKNELKRKYIALETAANDYEDAFLSDSSDIDAKTDAYEEQFNDVQNRESQLDNIYSELHMKRMEAWNGTVFSRIFSNTLPLRTKLKQLITNLKTDLKEADDPNKEAFINLLQLYYDLNALYFETNTIRRKYTSDEYYFQFQARYLISAHLIERTPDFFCKTAEDRSGRVNNIIEEFMAYRHFKGFIPAYDDKKRKADIERRISPRVHDYSASRETTALNAPGARGLQIKDAQGSQHLSTGILDRVIARTAKNIYKVRYKDIRERFVVIKGVKSLKQWAPNPAVYSPLREDQGYEFPVNDALTLVDQTHAILSGIKPLAERQLSAYLRLIVTLMDHNPPNRDALIQDLKAEISPPDEAGSGYVNPYMERIQRLIQLKEKLVDEQTRLNDQPELKSDPELNKTRLAAVNKTIRLLNSRNFTWLLKRYDAINSWMASDNPTNDEKIEIRSAAPSQLRLILKWPFAVRRNNPTKKPDKLLADLQEHSSDDLKKDIERLLPVILPVALNELTASLKETVIPAITDFEAHQPPIESSPNKADFEDQISEATEVAELTQIQQKLDQLERDQQILTIQQAELIKIGQTFFPLADRFARLVKIQYLLKKPTAKVVAIGGLLSSEQLKSLRKLNFDSNKEKLKQYTTSTPLIPQDKIDKLRQRIVTKETALRTAVVTPAELAPEEGSSESTTVIHKEETAAPPSKSVPVDSKQMEDYYLHVGVAGVLFTVIFGINALEVSAALIAANMLTSGLKGSLADNLSSFFSSKRDVANADSTRTLPDNRPVVEAF